MRIDSNRSANNNLIVCGAPLGAARQCSVRHCFRSRPTAERQRRQSSAVRCGANTAQRDAVRTRCGAMRCEHGAARCGALTTRQRLAYLTKGYTVLLAAALRTADCRRKASGGSEGVGEGTTPVGERCLSIGSRGYPIGLSASVPPHYSCGKRTLILRPSSTMSVPYRRSHGANLPHPSIRSLGATLITAVWDGCLYIVRHKIPHMPRGILLMPRLPNACRRRTAPHRRLGRYPIHTYIRRPI
jgi:hypothetical protein